MKKLTVISLAGLLILAFGATGYAQDVKLEFRASGSIDVQWHRSVNVPPLNPGATPIYNSLSTYNAFGQSPPAVGPLTYFPTNGQANNGGAPSDYATFNSAGRPIRALDRNVAYWDSRMSTRFEFGMGKELTAVLQFEIDAARWGSNQTHGGPGTGLRETEGVGFWSTDRAAIEVKYMYFDVGLPYFGIPVPMNIRVGTQPMAVRPAFLIATDGSGISGGIKIDPVTINPLYFKMLNGGRDGGNWNVDWTNTDNDV
jgi:hypothetical protein